MFLEPTGSQASSSSSSSSSLITLISAIASLQGCSVPILIVLSAAVSGMLGGRWSAAVSGISGGRSSAAMLGGRLSTAVSGMLGGRWSDKNSMLENSMSNSAVQLLGSLLTVLQEYGGLGSSSGRYMLSELRLGCVWSWCGCLCKEEWPQDGCFKSGREQKNQ